jgi:hypothetical protein
VPECQAKRRTQKTGAPCKWRSSATGPLAQIALRRIIIDLSPGRPLLNTRWAPAQAARSLPLAAGRDFPP